MSRIHARAALGVALLGAACAETPPPPPAQPPAAAAAAPAKAPPAMVPEGPPVTMLPAATARPLELVAISITSVDKLLTKGATLVGRAVPLPVEPAGLRDMLLQQAGLSPEVASNLDLASPSGAVQVATGPPGATGVVMAVAARGPVEAEHVIDALGKPIMKRGAVVLIDNGAGARGWVFRAGNVVVLSDEIDALARGAMLALEARHATSEDVTAVIHPSAIAQANGTDVKTAVAALLEAMRSGQLAQQSPGAPRPAAFPMFDEIADLVALVADVDTADIGLSVDGAKGLVIRVRLHPRAGTALADVARDKRPFELDQVVLSRTGSPALLGTASYGPIANKMVAHQRARLVAMQGPKQKSAAAALAFFDAERAAAAGQMSVACSLAGEARHFSCDISEPLKDAESAGKLGAGLAKLDPAAALAFMKARTGDATTWTVKKESVGKIKVLHYTQTFSKDTDPEVKKFLGRGLDTYLAIADKRLLMTLGHDAKARLGALAAGKTGAPQGALTDALGEASGRDGFAYVDLGSILSFVSALPGVSLGQAGALGKAASTPIPLHATLGGDGAGKVWSFDITVPAAAFAGAGSLVQGMMMPR